MLSSRLLRFRLQHVAQQEFSTDNVLTVTQKQIDAINEGKVGHADVAYYTRVGALREFKDDMQAIVITKNIEQLRSLADTGILTYDIPDEPETAKQEEKKRNRNLS